MTTTPPATRHAHPALVRACAAVGLDPAGATLVQRSVNTVYRLASAPVVVRIRGGGPTPEAIAQVGLARSLAAAGGPVSRLLEVDQLVEAGGYVATFWHADDEPDRKWRTDNLGRALRELHAVELTTDLPPWAPLETCRRRLAAVEWVDPADRAWLAAEIEDLESRYREVAPTLHMGLMHGDAHIANLLRAGDGRPVLCDIDSLARGPQVQDLVPTAVSAVRFRTRRRQQVMAATYGVDVTRHPAWPVLRRIRELVTTMFGLVGAPNNPQVAREAHHRLRTLQDGDTAARWYSYQSGPSGS